MTTYKNSSIASLPCRWAPPAVTSTGIITMTTGSIPTKVTAWYAPTCKLKNRLFHCDIGYPSNQIPPNTVVFVNGKPINIPTGNTIIGVNPNSGQRSVRISLSYIFISFLYWF